MEKKKNKKLKILILIGITCVIWGFVIMFISSVKKDQKAMNERMDTIIKSYDSFSKKIEEFNIMRDTLHTEFLDKVYYETLESKDVEFKNKLKKYEELVSSISVSTKDNLREYCKDNIYYASSDVNNKCAAFKQGYEEMVNSFVEDINAYNNNLTKYNAWLDSEGKTDSIKLEGYQTKKTYIDYNEDGVYSGREEEVTEKPVEENTSKEESDSNGQ